jgi:hypothetical protein
MIGTPTARTNSSIAASAAIPNPRRFGFPIGVSCPLPSITRIAQNVSHRYHKSGWHRLLSVMAQVSLCMLRIDPVSTAI